MVGGMRQPPAKPPVNQAVIAKLPQHIKSILMGVSFLNSAVFIFFAFGWLGMEEGMSVVKIAVSAGFSAFSVVFLPIIMWLVTRTDWGQRNSGGS